MTGTDRHIRHLESTKEDRMAIKLTKEEALAYVRKIEDENKALKNRCYILSGGGLCVFCGYDCKHREGGQDE